MTEVLAGQCTDAQIAALLVALRMKGETVEEIVGFAEAIRAAAAPLPIELDADASLSAAPAAMPRETSNPWSTPAAPAAMPAAPSTFRPRRPLSPPEPACASPSTAIAASARSAAPPT